MGGFGRGLIAGCLPLVPLRPNGLLRMTVAISSGESSGTGSGVYESRDVDRPWVITAYALAFGSLLLFGGRLGDLFGRKMTFLIGLIGFAGASAVGGASVNFTMLVTARACQGAFGALLAPAALSLLTTTFSNPDERGKAFGVSGLPT